MKKARIIAVIAALIVSLSGCANTDHPQAIQDSSGIETVASKVDERTEPEDCSSASVSESKGSTADSTTTVKAETESAQAENSQPAAEQSPAPREQPPQTVVPNNTPKPETPKAVEPTPEPKPETPQQPTPEPVQTAPPQETTPATEEPAPKSIYDFEFDISAIRAELIAVGEAMGLTHSGDLTPDGASWSTPVTASSDFQGANLERRLKDYVQSMPGLITAFGGNQIEYFTIYAEPLGGGSYRFYFLY